jgi:hypothetical protein
MTPGSAAARYYESYMQGFSAYSAHPGPNGLY